MDDQAPTQFGYALSSEEHGPTDLVRHAALAERAGFDFAMLSDHFHPWIDHQGQSPFAWSVIGGIAATTDRLAIATGVTCPIIRIHPAIIAQAAATSAAMLPGRFALGVGTGENLNEHVLGDRWPAAHTRRAMLAEAVEVIRALWTGEEISHDGRFYTVENARLYTLPDAPPPILVAASGPRAAELAGEIGDGLVTTSPDAEVLEAFERTGGMSRARYGQVTVSWGADADRARETAMTWWPTSAIPGELSVELPTPGHFEQALQRVREEDVTASITCGPDLDAIVDAVRPYLEAGFDHVYLHQVGPDQAAFLGFAERELLPALRELRPAEPPSRSEPDGEVARPVMAGDQV